MLTDPVADMLTRIRNAVDIERPFVDIPLSQEKSSIAQVLQREGYIWDFEQVGEGPRRVLRLNLKYGPNGERLIQEIKRVSKPGCRKYSKSTELPSVLQGLGICIVSTSHGILSDREARTKGIGGEILCTVR